MTTTTHASAGIDLDSPLIAALKSARELLANLDGLSKNNICNLAAEEVEQIDAALARRTAEAAPAANADLIAKLSRVSRWIDKFPVPTDGATAMMRHLRDVSDALASHAGLSQFANGEDAGKPAQAVDAKCSYCDGDGEHYQGPSKYTECTSCDGTGKAHMANAQQDAAPIYQHGTRTVGSDVIDWTDVSREDYEGYTDGLHRIVYAAPIAVAPSDATGKADECNVSEFSSRICERGTKSCTKVHFSSTGKADAAIAGALDLVTLESALEAIDHVSANNGPGRIVEARRMLAPATSAADAQDAADLRMAICNIPLPVYGSNSFQHGFVSAKEAVLDLLSKRAAIAASRKGGEHD